MSKKKHVNDEIARLEERVDKMPNEEPRDAAEAALHLMKNLASIGQDDKAFEIAEWLEEDVINPAIEYAEEYDDPDVIVTMHVNLGPIELHQSHGAYKKHAIEFIKNANAKLIRSQCKVSLISYE